MPMRMIDAIKTLDLAALPELYNGASERDPAGSGWCRRSAPPRWTYRPKNSAIVAELFRRFPVRAALEIGVCFGAGLDLLRHFGGEDLLLVGIDPMTKPLALIRSGGGAQDLPAFHHPRTVLIQKRSSEAAEDVRRVLKEHALDGFDLIVIDGDHSYEAALGDLLTYSGFLQADGAIYWDDARHNSVVRELKIVPRLKRRFELFGFGLENDPSYDACWIALRGPAAASEISPERLRPRWVERGAARLLHKLSGAR